MDVAQPHLSNQDKRGFFVRKKSKFSNLSRHTKRCFAVDSSNLS
jgi:hypothetical protein